MQASPSSPWSRASKQSHSHRPSTTRPHCPLRITNRLTSGRSWNRTYPHSVAQSHRVLSRRYTPPLHPASILDNPLAPEMQQFELCGHDSFWRRPACIRCGDRIIDVPQLVAEGEYLCRDCFQQLLFETATPARPLAPGQHHTEVATEPVSSVSPPAATGRQ